MLHQAPVYFRGFTLDEQSKKWIPAQARLQRRVIFFPPFNPAQRPSKEREYQQRGIQSARDYFSRLSFGKGGPLTGADLGGLGNMRQHFPQQDMDLQQKQRVTPFAPPTGREVIPGVR